MDKTKLKDAVRTAVGKSKGKDLVVCCMDFAFIGGSMGAVVGEKISRGIDYSIKNKVPFVMISKSGGARMMEAAYSLMQLAKPLQNWLSLPKQKFHTYHFVLTQLLEEQLLPMLCLATSILLNLAH
jgi:acetyl-CoA carboxylase carboxyl transferase subunit beta